jgi:DNA-binding transcriptional ArsR family regulator
MGRAVANADVFHAVADVTRRRMLDLLADGERMVSDIVDCFRVSQPAISQHLKVLREAGLVRVRQDGRHRFYRLNGAHLKEIAAWVTRYEQFWDDRLSHLGRHLRATHPDAFRADNQEHRI